MLLGRRVGCVKGTAQRRYKRRAERGRQKTRQEKQREREHMSCRRRAADETDGLESRDRSSFPGESPPLAFAEGLAMGFLETEAGSFDEEWEEETWVPVGNMRDNMFATWVQLFNGFVNHSLKNNGFPDSFSLESSPENWLQLAWAATINANTVFGGKYAWTTEMMQPERKKFRAAFEKYDTLMKRIAKGQDPKLKEAAAEYTEKVQRIKAEATAKHSEEIKAIAKIWSDQVLNDAMFKDSILTKKAIIKAQA